MSHQAASPARPTGIINLGDDPKHGIRHSLLTGGTRQEPGFGEKESPLLSHYVTLLAERLRRDEGATMVEYGIMVALIAVVSILVIAAIGTDLFGAFTNVETQLP